ncbi:hypothetical protein BESB_068410 [Besnoitia besnoiti]|uniref:Uncharacterized protein n=1 Tax=Besnoitia besnoiti TaxID=94643 RepID=A0A2A9M8K3_BESBE|nr:hypothetical protein BESB_068410 [Besnoitia besnoiti]PFH34808.1 hypothetical protein BESB_068410 [Besnoitia besnoiti]
MASHEQSSSQPQGGEVHSLADARGAEIGSRQLSVPESVLGSTDGADVSHRIVEVGGADGGTMVIRRARVRAQRPQNYFAAPAAINVMAVRSRANSVVPSAANSPRAHSAEPVGSSDDLVGPGVTPSPPSGDAPGACSEASTAAVPAQSPPATQHVQSSRPAVSQLMRAEFAHANAVMERRRASRAQSRQASHVASRATSPRGSFADHLSPSAFDRRRMGFQEPSAAAQRLDQDAVDSSGFKRVGAAEAERPFDGAPEGKSANSRSSVGNVLLNRGTLGTKSSSTSVVSGREEMGGESLPKDKGGDMAGMEAPVLGGDPSSLVTAERSGGTPSSTAVLPVTAVPPRTGERRGSEGEHRLGKKHAEQVHQGVLDMVKLEEERRVSRIASRIASRAISRNPAEKSVSFLRERTDVTHAAAEALRRHLAAEGSDAGKGPVSDTERPQQTKEAFSGGLVRGDGEATVAPRRGPAIPHARCSEVSSVRGRAIDAALAQQT